MGESIQMKGVGKRLGNRWVLNGIDLSIAAGESVALFGGNGSGKSTLLKVLATLLAPSCGEVRVLGFDIRREQEEIRRRVRYLAHQKQLYDSLTVRENMELAARIRGVPATEIDRLLERLGILAARDHRVTELSEGMKKRLVLARLLLGEADLILLDEPHPTLDEQGRKVLAEMIGEWRKGGKTLIVASHDRSETLANADRALTLENGRIRQ